MHLGCGISTGERQTEVDRSSGAALRADRKAAATLLGRLGRRGRRFDGDGPAMEGFQPMATQQLVAEINAWDVAQRQFDLAAERLQLPAACARCCGNRSEPS